MTDADIDRSELRTAVRDMLDDICPPTAVRAAADTDSGFDEQLWKRLAEMGLVGVEVDDRFDGAGAAFGDLAVVLVELGRHLGGGAFAATTALGAGALLGAPDSPPAGRWLPRIASGEVRASAAVNAWDDTGRGFTANRNDAGWTLDGASAYVADAAAADMLVVVATTEDGRPVACAVEASSPGLRIEPVAMLDVTRRFAEVRADDVTVTDEQVVAEGDDTSRLVSRLIDRAALAAACDAIGVAERVLELTVDYAKTRVQFDRPIGSFQAVKHRCSDMFIAVETARVALDEALDRYDANPDDASAAISRAKAYCCDAANAVAEAGVDLHGGIGFTWEHDMHLLLKRAGLDAALYGDPRWHRRRAADLMFPG